jgi:hypothetical protein
LKESQRWWRKCIDFSLIREKRESKKWNIFVPVERKVHHKPQNKLGMFLEGRGGRAMYGYYQHCSMHSQITWAVFIQKSNTKM